MKPVLLAAALMTSFYAFAEQANYLTDQNGMTLYSFDKDHPGVSNCNDQCAVNWPPYLVSDHKHTKPGWRKISRKDGRWQWAYKNQPLYYWAGDTQAGNQNGDNIGGVWHIVSTEKNSPQDYEASTDDGYGY